MHKLIKACINQLILRLIIKHHDAIIFPMKKITNKWELMNYINSSDVSLTNTLVAVYLYEHHDCLMNKSINFISKDSPFSQSTISRFMTHIVGSDLLNYRTNEIYVKSFLTSKLAVVPLKKDLDIIEMISDEVKDIQNINPDIWNNLTNQLLQSKHILFFGTEHSIIVTESLQNTLLFLNVLPYAPRDYSASEFFVKSMKEEDTIIVLSIDPDWIQSPEVTSSLEKLQLSNAKKLLLTTLPVDSNIQKYFDETIHINVKNEFFTDFKTAIFFKLLELKLLRNLPSMNDD